MDDNFDNQEESAPKRSRSDEKIKADKETSSSGDSGQQSPHVKHQQQEDQNLSVCKNNGNTNNNNHFNSNSDSGFSLKMEDSSCGDADVADVIGISKYNNADDDNTMAALPINDKPDLDDQQMSTNDSVTNHEEAATLSTTNINDKDTVSGDVDIPTTSSSHTHIKRHKRNRSRNYRVSGRSSSSSSETSKLDCNEGQHEEPAPQEHGESQESTNPIADTPSPATNNAAEESSPYMFLPNLNESSRSSISIDTSSNSDDVDTDFEPSFLGDLRPDDISNDSEYSNRLKEKDEEVDKVLNKQKPPYTWCASYELLRREHGLSGDGRKSLPNGCSYGFKNRFYASRHIVERMKISHVLRKHSGCVNCLNFNKSGDLLVTGSDDARLIVWDWAANKAKHVWKSGHSANIFQSKFLPASSCIDIISAGRDGKVRRSVVPPSGGKVQVSHLYLHSGAVHKLVVCPDNPSEVISVGEDGLICSKDLREDNPKVDMLKVVSTIRKTRKVRLFSISHHPLAPEICVSGSDQYVRVYDKRSMKDAVYLMSPEHILETNAPNVTCCVYNNTGTEILATYSEDNIYLFNNKNYIPGEYLHSYKGHFNQKTIKGVNFFGPNCEYVISGSDCSNIFFWDKNTEAILNFMPGDTAGVVNCLEPHPNTPILATSGLDHNVKIWTPSAEKYPPDLTKLTNCVRRNIRRTVIKDCMDLDSQQLQSIIRQILCRPRGDRRRNRNGDDSGSGNASSSDSSEPEIHSDNGDDDDTDDDDADVANLRHLTCGTQ